MGVWGKNVLGRGGTGAKESGGVHVGDRGRLRGGVGAEGSEVGAEPRPGHGRPADHAMGYLAFALSGMGRPWRISKWVADFTWAFTG